MFYTAIQTILIQIPPCSHQFKRFPLTKLLTLSHNKLLNDVINTLDKFDLVELHLEDAMNMLTQLKPQMKKAGSIARKAPFDQRDEGEREKKAHTLRYYFIKDAIARESNCSR